jgi:3-oxoacyl-[acyl-carrier-protein] synthase-3
LIAVGAGISARTTGARVVGVVSCVPPRVVDNSEFEQRFGSGAAEVTKMTGVLQRYYADPGVTTSDLCEAAAEVLLEKLEWERDSVDGIIFVSQSPDHIVPATSCMVQARMGLRTGIVAYDVNLGCSGYPYGLWQAMMAVQTGAVRRILLMAGDVSTRSIDANDRGTAMLFGDAGTVTAIEATDEESVTHFILGTDGRGAGNLIIPRSRQRILKEEPHYEGRDLDALYMDGGEVFNFTLKSVPPLIRETIELAGETVDSYDTFLLHQANTFMINHISKKAKLPKEKVPINMDRFGNTSSATIPLLMTTDNREMLMRRRCKVGMFGFGIGYSWASASMDVGPLQCLEHIVL